MYISGIISNGSEQSYLTSQVTHVIVSSRAQWTKIVHIMSSLGLSGKSLLNAQDSSTKKVVHRIKW